MVDQRIAKWTSWIEGDVTKEVMKLNHNRAIKDRVNEIRNTETLPDSAWWQYLDETYGESQAVAVRRLADKHRGTASLRNLIAEIAGAPGILTREFWIDLWRDPTDVEFATFQWNKQFGGEKGDHLDPAIPAADLAHLIASTDDVVNYVDRRVCHRDRRQQEPVINFKQVHDAAGVVGDLFNKYTGLLTAKSWAFLTPAIQHDWEAPFRMAWISERSRKPRGLPPR